jgi:hypothetical protein
LVFFLSAKAVHGRANTNAIAIASIELRIALGRLRGGTRAVSIVETRIYLSILPEPSTPTPQNAPSRLGIDETHALLLKLN